MIIGCWYFFPSHTLVSSTSSSSFSGLLSLLDCWLSENRSWTSSFLLLKSYVSFKRFETGPFIPCMDEAGIVAAVMVVGLIFGAAGSVGEDKFEVDVLDENEDEGEYISCESFKRALLDTLSHCDRSIISWLASSLLNRLFKSNDEETRFCC